MKITRTYPQPDSPAPNIGPRERAMAIYKYLLNMEPEQAVEHSRFGKVEGLFEDAALGVASLFCAYEAVSDLGLVWNDLQGQVRRCVVQAFEQERRRQRGLALNPSVLPLLSSETADQDGGIVRLGPLESD